MPRDMAMERPDTGVVQVVLHDHVAVRADELDVAALRVGRVDDAAAVPVSRAFGEDLHVVAVEMHGMRGGRRIIDDDAHGAVGAEVLDVPFVGVGEVSLLGEQEDRAVVVYAKGGAV